jgi:hypothetical protein
MVGTPKKDYATVFCIWLVFVLWWLKVWKQ